MSSLAAGSTIPGTTPLVQVGINITDCEFINNSAGMNTATGLNGVGGAIFAGNPTSANTPTILATPSLMTPVNINGSTFSDGGCGLLRMWQLFGARYRQRQRGEIPALRPALQRRDERGFSHAAVDGGAGWI